MKQADANVDPSGIKPTGIKSSRVKPSRVKPAKFRTELQDIPGVGPSIEKDLIDLGITKINDLQKKDPEELYNNLMALRKQYIDRCVLYVFRCAVYFAENDKYDPELLKWWNWKDTRNKK